MNIISIVHKIIKKYENKRFTLLSISLIFITLVLIKSTGLKYLFIGSITEFKSWFPNYGFILWKLKTMVFIIFLLKAFLTFRYGLTLLLNNFIQLKKHVYFFGLIFFTFAFDEVYPFSFYPMYNEFPNWSYSFYFTDDKQNIIQLKNGNYNGISHQYAAVASSKGISYGNAAESEEELLIIGKELIYNSFSNNPSKTIYLFRIHNYFDENGKVVSDTILMANSNEK